MAARDGYPVADSDSDASESVDDPEGCAAQSWKWQSILPSHGLDRYVCALQMLGQDLALALPKKVRELAITPLGVEPQESLLRGDFKCIVRERTLFLDSNILPAGCVSMPLI